MIPENLDELVAERLSAWCKRYTVKDLARMLDVKERTVVSWRSGNLPQMRHLIRMVDQFGAEFLDDIFSPVIGFGQVGMIDRLNAAIEDLQAIVRNLAKSPMMMIIFFAVACTLTPVDAEVLRPPRPTTSRTRKD